MLKKYPVDAGKNPILDAEKTQVLKKHLLDAGKNTWCWKSTFLGLEKHQAYFQGSVSHLPVYLASRQEDD